MISVIMGLLAGLVLLAGKWRRVPGAGSALERGAQALLPFAVVIGIAAIAVGFLDLLSLEGVLLLLAGLVLSAEALRSIPSMGRSLGRLGDALGQFRTIIGIVVLTMAILDVVVLVLGWSGGRGLH